MSNEDVRYSNIVVGVDLGPHGKVLTAGSALAVRQAEQVASHYGSSISLVHSTALDEHWASEKEGFVSRQGSTADGRAALEAAVEGLSSAGIDATLSITEERAWLAVLLEARNRGAELVIVGKRSAEKHDGRRLGSVSLELLHACPGDVWVVRPASNPEPRVILAATDLGPVGTNVVHAAASVADAFGSELHIVHAASLPLDIQFEGEEATASFERDSRVEASQRIREVLAGFDVAETAHLHVGIASPTQAVLAGEKQLSPDLVVMGTISRGGIPGFVVGNTAERLLGRLDTSLLTIKPDDFPCPVTGS